MLRDEFFKEAGGVMIKIIEQSLIVVIELSDKIIMDDYLEGLLNNRAHRILWFRKGLFCMIPKEIIQNALDLIDAYVKSSRKTKSPIITITWDQGIPVDPKVGYALMGE